MTTPPRVSTTLTAPGERAVKVDGTYAGLVFRDADGWHYAGHTAPVFRTFTDAARYVAARTTR